MRELEIPSFTLTHKARGPTCVLASAALKLVSNVDGLPDIYICAKKLGHAVLMLAQLDSKPTALFIMSCIYYVGWGCMFYAIILYAVLLSLHITIHYLNYHILVTTILPFTAISKN